MCVYIYIYIYIYEKVQNNSIKPLDPLLYFHILYTCVELSKFKASLIATMSTLQEERV